MLKPFLILSIFLCNIIGVNAQSGRSIYGAWSYGLTGSADYFLSTLVDAPRLSIDSVFSNGMSDELYLENRKSVDGNYIGFTAGLLVQYRMKPRTILESGIQLVKAGTKINGTKITDGNFLNMLGSEISNKTVVNSYNIIEFPFVFRTRIGKKPRFELGKSRASMITKKRYFFYSYGLGIGLPLNNRSYYNGPELTDVQANLGLAALFGLGIHQDFSPHFFMNLRLHGRATFLSYYEYAPIKTYFHAIGAEAKIGYRLPFKAKKEKDHEKSVNCATWQSTPVPDGRNRFVMGLRYGLNVNKLMGTDAKNKMIAYKGIVEKFGDRIESITGDINSTYSPHVGIHLEYLFHPRFSLTAIPTYAQRGYVADYTYFMETGESIRSRHRMYLDYGEMPVRINYYPTNRLWVHASATVSFNFSNRLYNYYQEFQSDPTANLANESFKQKQKVKDVYGYSPDKFIMGYGMGFGYHVDENFSVSLQGIFYEPIFVQDSGRENFFHFVPQLSLYYFFLTK